ncbi:MAG: diguanylate cyclase [Pseudomonadota bacterium]
MIGLLAILADAVGAAHGADVVPFTDSMGHVPLVAHAEFLEDANGILSAHEVHARGDELPWRAAPPGSAFNAGLSSSVYWLRFRLRYLGAAPTERLLEAAIPQVDDARVYAFVDNAQVQALTLGDSLPFSSRPVRDRRQLAPLEFQPGESTDVYVRLASMTSVQAPLALWTRDAFYGQPTAYGAFYGIMLAMILYNLLLFASVDGRRYLFLALFAAATTMYHATVFGHSYQYLWPDNPWWNTASMAVFGFLAAACFAVFALGALDVKSANPWLRNALFTAACVAAALAVAGLLVPVPIATRLQMGYVFVVVPLVLAAGIVSWRNGVDRAGEFTLSWLAFLSGTFALGLTRFGALPLNVLTAHALEVGLIVQLVILLYGAFTSSLRVLREGYRTERKFATHDDLTGLPNRRLFNDRLHHALDKGRSRSVRVGLLFIDLDGFKSVNDTLGHTCGDLLLKGVADRLITAVRRGDTVARIGGDEFTVILEDMSHNLDATLVARKITALFEQPIELPTGMKLTIRPSIGVACFPDDGNTAELLMGRADQAMYEAKSGGAAPARRRAGSVL